MMEKSGMTMAAIRLIARMAAALMVLSPMLGAQAATPVAVANAAYVLGPLDQIEINIANFTDLTTRTRIDTDNSVVLPLIGRVTIGGMSAAAAATVIEQRYREGGFINAPSVRVEVVEYQSRKVSVLGQVNTQGMIPLDRAYSVAEILARAGGLSPDAADTAVIIRPTAIGTDERIPVDLTQLVTATAIPAGAGGASLRIQPGDTIFVPRAPTFSVVGAVNHAGVYRLVAGMTVQQALATAGDIARVGTRSGLKIRRAKPGGAPELIPAGLDDPVEPGDVIVVRERVF
jgi:polysaccharide export outer membrane protein